MGLYFFRVINMLYYGTLVLINLKFDVEDYEDAYFRYLMLKREIGLVRQDIEELDRFFEGDWCNELMLHRLDPIAVRDKTIALAKEFYEANKGKYEIKYIPKKNKKKSSTENES